MIIALIINVQTTLLHFLTPLIIIFSYKVQIQVKDHTTIVSFVLFDKDAEKIIQKTAMEFSSKVSVRTQFATAPK